MPIFNSSKKSDDERWSKIIWRQEVYGECQKCKSGKRALWTVYGDHSEIIRCLHCKSTDQFLIDPNAFNDPRKYPPLSTDEIDAKIRAWENRYTRGDR